MAVARMCRRRGSKPASKLLQTKYELVTVRTGLAIREVRNPLRLCHPHLNRAPKRACGRLDLVEFAGVSQVKQSIYLRNMPAQASGQFGFSDALLCHGLVKAQFFHLLRVHALDNKQKCCLFRGELMGAFDISEQFIALTLVETQPKVLVEEVKELIAYTDPEVAWAATLTE